MISVEMIRENADEVRSNYERRGEPVLLEILDDVIDLDERWREAKRELDDLRAKHNELTEQIREEESEELIEEAKDLSERINNQEEAVENLREQRDEEWEKLPNLLHEDVPEGEDEEDNEEIRTWGEPETPGFDMVPHGEFLEESGWADLEKAAEVSGRGFGYLQGDIALLDNALQRFTTDFMLDKDFTPVIPPYMVREEPMSGTTDLDFFRDMVYKIEDEDLYLIPTSETPLIAKFKGEVIPEEELPIKLMGISPCFRKEVGAHGIDTRGIYRVHQFHKIEQVVVSHPEESWDWMEKMQSYSEEIVKELEIPYRVVDICTGDIGNKQARQYDIEAWFPRQESYGEVTSCSNCTDYQARALNIRYGKYGGEKDLAHVLNNTAIATSRIIVAIVENFQNEDGTVEIPEALQDYMNGKEVMEPPNREK